MLIFHYSGKSFFANLETHPSTTESIMQFKKRAASRISLLSFVLVAGMNAAHADEGVCEPAKLATKYPSLVGKTVKIGQDGETPPFSMRDPKDFAKLAGIDADMARAVFACAGVPVSFTTGNWSGLIPAAISGQIDVMWDQLLYTPERAKKMDFVAYMNSATGMMVAKGNPKKLKTFDDICGVKATAGLGTTQETMVREQSEKCTRAGRPGIEIITSADVPSGLRLVQSGRADLLVANKFVVDQMVASNSNTVENAFDVVTGAKLAAGTAKGNADLVKLMHDGLSIIQANGTLKRIYQQYNVDFGLVIKPTILTQ
jgi:polar amino acid transport system substrate-binding protein